jgi:hypothetical protein
MLWQRTPYLITNFVIDFWVVSFVALEKIDATSFVMFKRTYTPYNEFCKKIKMSQGTSKDVNKNLDLGFSLQCASPGINNSPPFMLLLKKNTHTHVDKLLVMFELPLLFSITTPAWVLVFKKKVNTMKLSMMPKLSVVFS